MIDLGLGAFVLLWLISRSGFSARYVYPVSIKNPADKLTQGYIDDQGKPVQPTYGKMKVGFDAPKAEKCYSSRVSKDGIRRYEVWLVDEQPSRVNITVPSGYKGAGNQYNIASWITPNLGQGYYVMINALKEGRGGRPSYANTNMTPAEKTAFSQKAIGVSWRTYETGQRYIRHPYTPEGKASAKMQMNELINNWDSETAPPSDPTPPVQPELPPLDPPELPPDAPELPPDLPPPSPPIDPIPPQLPPDFNPPSQPTFPSFSKQSVNIDQQVALNGSDGVSLMGDY